MREWTCWGEAAYPCGRWLLPFRQQATYPPQACLDQSPNDLKVSRDSLLEAL